jgi:hypothetical protein
VFTLVFLFVSESVIPREITSLAALVQQTYTRSERSIILSCNIHKNFFSEIETIITPNFEKKIDLIISYGT